MDDKTKELLNEIDDNLEIDLLDLHLEWQKQSLLYKQYSSKLSEYSIQKDEDKKKIDREYARLDLKFRREKKEKKEKFLESEIKSLIEVDPFYIKKWNLYFGISRIVGDLQNAVRALDQKKRSLENEVQLYQSGYYSTPKERKINIKSINKITENKVNRQRELLNKKKIRG